MTDPEEIRHLVRHGGRAVAADGAQLVIAWDRRVKPEDREAWAEKLLAPQVKRARRPRHNPARGRRALDRAEDKGLAAREREPDTSGRCWVVRIYRSAGGEVLCFDAGPMSMAAAESVRDAHRAQVSSKYFGRPCTDALGAEMRNAWTGQVHGSGLRGEVLERDIAPEDVRAVARFVVLPSQVVGPRVQVVEREEDAA